MTIDLGFDPADDAVLSLLSDAEAVDRFTAHWEPRRRAALIRFLESHVKRETLRKRYSTPADIAAACDPGFVRTPTVDLLSNLFERVIVEPQRNLIVSVPPQEGKSTLSHYAILRALQHDPNTRCVLATYGDDLAEEQSHATREIIKRHGSNVVDPITQAAVDDRLGFELDPNSHAVKRWRVRGYKGGLVAVGIGSALTGRAADLMIVDDPFKSMQDADSKARRDQVFLWMQSVAQTRLSPDASVVLIQTRWHEDDLAGRIETIDRELPRELRSWKVVNIPAVAEPGIPDSLQREPGAYIESARGRDEKWYESKRRDVGERVWYALYQGSPKPMTGGLFHTDWFESNKIDILPAEMPLATVVAVDPAETGKRDEAGVVAGSAYPGRSNGRTRQVITHDRSGLMTSDQWARAAVSLAVEVGAGEIAIESYTTGNTYAQLVKRTYERMHADGEIVAWAGGIAPPTCPFRVFAWRGKGDSLARSAPLRQAVEVGDTAIHGDPVNGPMSKFVEQAVGWQQGQHQPDRVAAAVILHSRLAESSLGSLGLGNPVEAARRANGGAGTGIGQAARLGRKIAGL